MENKEIKLCQGARNSSLGLLSTCLFVIQFRFDAMLFSNLGGKNSDAGHIKCSRTPHLARGLQVLPFWSISIGLQPRPRLCHCWKYRIKHLLVRDNLMLLSSLNRVFNIYLTEQTLIRLYWR